MNLIVPIINHSSANPILVLCRYRSLCPEDTAAGRLAADRAMQVASNEAPADPFIGLEEVSYDIRIKVLSPQPQQQLLGNRLSDGLKKAVAGTGADVSKFDSENNHAADDSYRCLGVDKFPSNSSYRTDSMDYSQLSEINNMIPAPKKPDPIFSQIAEIDHMIPGIKLENLFEVLCNMNWCSLLLP